MSYSNILSLIESSIKKGNADINSFAINLITNIRKIISKNSLENIIINRISKKNIYFLRHPEAQHNVLERKYRDDFSKFNIYDPELTDTGINQMKSTIEKNKKELINFDIVFVSPLTRTIQTFFLIKNYLKKDAQIIITDFIKEVLSYFLDKNKGKQLSVLKKEFKQENFNFEYMTKEYWWYDLGENIDNESEGDLNFSLRLKIFILWLIFRPENNILIISHSNVYFELQDNGIVNARMSKMDNNILLEKVLELNYIQINEDKSKKCNIF